MCKLVQHLSQSSAKATGEGTTRLIQLLNYLRGGLYRVNANSGKKVLFPEKTREKIRKADIVRRVVIIATQIENEQEKKFV